MKNEKKMKKKMKKKRKIIKMRHVTSSAGFGGIAKLRMLLYNKRAVFLGVFTKSVIKTT